MANQVTTTFKINAQGAINALNQYNTQLQQTIKLQKQLGGTVGAGGGGGAGGGAEPAGGLGVGGLAFGAKGLLGPLAGIVTIGAAIQTAKQAISAFSDLTTANRALSASATEAGKAFYELAEASEFFAEKAGVSQATAARSTAQLQRLLVLAGESDKLEQYQQGFLDLAAARGVAFQELDTLFQGIIAGTDDALNRFGKADPSKLAEQYARSIGKTTEQLTEQEKVLSRLTAFEKDFGLFSGANEDRLNSFTGSVDRFNAKLDDTLAKFGEWIARNKAINFLLDQSLKFFGQIGPSESERKQLSEAIAGGQTAQQAALEITAQKFEDNPLFQTFIRKARTAGDIEQIKQVLTGLDIAGGSNLQDFVSLIAEGEKETNQIISAREKLASDEAAKREERAKKSREQNIADLKNRVEEETRLRQLNLSVYEARLKSVADGSLTRELENAKLIGKARLDAIQQESDAKLQALGFQLILEKDNDKRRKILAEGQMLGAEADAAAEQERLATLAQIQSIEKQIADQQFDTFFRIAELRGEQNPYVRIFLEASKALDDLQKKEKDLGKGLADGLRRSILSGAGLQTFQQDIGNLLQATSLRRQARELSFGIDPSRFGRRRQEAYQRQAIEEDLGAIERAFRRRENVDREQAERLRDQAVIQATAGATYRQLTPQSRQLAIEAREREATRLEQDRDQARQLFERLLKDLSGDGIRVKLAEGQQIVRVINDAPGRAEVTSRPGQADTNARYR